MFDITVRVGRERVLDLLTTAFEGAVGYWCQVERWETPDGFELSEGPGYAELPLVKGGAVVCTDVVYPDPDDECYRLDLEALQRGLLIMASEERYQRHWTAVITADFDAETADVFVQLALFGEVVYG